MNGLMTAFDCTTIPYHTWQAKTKTTTLVIWDRHHRPRDEVKASTAAMIVWALSVETTKQSLQKQRKIWSTRDVHGKQVYRLHPFTILSFSTTIWR